MEPSRIAVLTFLVSVGLLTTLAMQGYFGNAANHSRLRLMGEPALWIVPLAALGFGRLAFVMSQWPHYAHAPAAIFDFRDGGFHATLCVTGATMLTLWLGHRSPALRRPLLFSLLAGVVLSVGSMRMLAQGAETRLIRETVLTDLDGKAIRLESFLGKPVVLNLWATWCPPCRRELPILQAAQQANPDIAFVFADQGESAEAVRAALRRDGLGLGNVLLDPDRRIGKCIWTVEIPATVFFDATGKMIKTQVGPVSTASLDRLLESVYRSRR